MRIAIVRREKGNALSMDVYADNLVTQLRIIRPHWEIVELTPQAWSSDAVNSWHSGNPVRKYYERFWRYPRAVSQYQADIFHIIDHTDGHIVYWLKKLGKPVIVTCHDLVQYIYPKILKGQARFPPLSMATWRYSVQGMKQAERIIAVSQNTAQDVSKMLDISADKITVASNGVDAQFRVLPDERVAKRRKQHAATEEICLLNVGSTHQRKNIETILKVLETLRQKSISIRLWKVGSDFTPPQKAYISARQLESCITWIPQPDRETLIELYNAADILLAPSLYEGFGLTVIEAMACGTPVITANVSALPEVAGDAAVLVEPFDVTAIAEAVVRLGKDSTMRNHFVKSGLIRAKQFTWSRTAATIAERYEALSGDCQLLTI